MSFQAIILKYLIHAPDSRFKLVMNSITYLSVTRCQLKVVAWMTLLIDKCIVDMELIS